MYVYIEHYYFHIIVFVLVYKEQPFCCPFNHIGGVMFSMLASSAILVLLEFNHKIGICCFSTNHAALKSKSKDWLAQCVQVEGHVYRRTVV